MKNKIGLFAIFTIIFLQFSFSSKTDDNWKLIKDKNGIKAYTREVENSDTKQVKVITNLRSTLSALVAIVKDVNSHINWIYACKRAKTVKIVSEKEYYYYNESEAPWPISNRDIVTHSVIEQDKKTKSIIITSNGKPNLIDEIEGIVRIQRLYAHWYFDPKKDGTVDLSFDLLIDLGGGLPSWLINMAIADGPYETVLNMVKEVKKDKYQKVNLSYIEEL